MLGKRLFSLEIFTSMWFAALLLMAVIPYLWPILSVVEGRRLPVVTDVFLPQAKELPDGSASFRVMFYKDRPCDFSYLVWQVRNPLTGAMETVNIRRAGSREAISVTGEAVRSYTRPTGWQVTAPWVVEGVGLEEIEAGVATVWHKCHGLWRTQTRLYPGLRTDRSDEPNMPKVEDLIGSGGTDPE